LTNEAWWPETADLNPKVSNRTAEYPEFLAKKKLIENNQKIINYIEGPKRNYLFRMGTNNNLNKLKRNSLCLKGTNDLFFSKFVIT